MNIRSRKSIHNHRTKCSSPISVNENRNITIASNVNSDEDNNTEDERLDALDSSNEENDINDTTQSISSTPEYQQRKSNISNTKQYENIYTNLIAKQHISASEHNFTLIIVLLFVAFASVYYFSLNQSTAPAAYKICSFDNFRAKYPNQHESVWRRLTVGIENILNKRVKEPAVYLFLHEGKQGIDQLIKEIAAHYSSCFGHDMKPVEIESNDFTSDNAVKDYGYAIEKYKLKIKEGKVILIANLNEIPAVAARALHTICDTISPIAHDVIIILTLVAPNVEGHAVQIARDALEELWAPKLSYNELEALITRVTADVIVLQS